MALFAPLLLLSCLGAAPEPPAPPVLAAMQAELRHSLAALNKQPSPAYFLAYQAREIHGYQIGAQFGALYSSHETRSRHLDLDLRVGSAKLDNTHPLRGLPGVERSLGGSALTLPLEDDPAALRGALWFHTDQAYREALERLGKVRTNMQVNVAEEDPAPDFSAEPPVQSIQPPAELSLDRKLWEDKLRRYTRGFSQDPAIEAGSGHLSVQASTTWYVNSEGSLLQLPGSSVNLSLVAQIRARDGVLLHRFASYYAPTPAGLPSDQEIQARVAGLVKELLALRDAPVEGPYTGPAMLSGRAASVFFHEVLGHRLEGQHLKGADQGRTLRAMVGQEILPASISIASDPTLERFGQTPLAGHYAFDDEGVPARRVPVVTDGVLKNFLLSRMPIAGFPASNGHGRRAPGYRAVARQSSLVVRAAAPVSRARLKELLLERVKAEHKPYGLLFDDIEGGFTFSSVLLPNAFNVRPLMTYRVHPDGREELVRGVDFIGTPLDAMARILAADDEPQVFNGVCGAESGGVPVSAVSPGLLLSRIEVQNKERNQSLGPILPVPADPETER